LSAAPLTRSGGAVALCGDQKWLRRQHRGGTIAEQQFEQQIGTPGAERISARFSGHMAPVVWARTSEISAVVVATPLRDLGLLFFSCRLPAAFSVPCWLSGADPEWLQHVCAGLWCTAVCGRECQRVSSDMYGGGAGGVVVV